MSLALTGAGKTSPSVALSYAAEVLADGPDLYWRFLETSGTNADDSSPNNKDGTYGNGPTLNQAGPKNKSITLDGSNDNVISVNTFTTTTVTLECWVYITGNPGAVQAIIGRDAGNGTFDKEMRLGTDGKVTFFVFAGGSVTVTSASVVPLSQWVHLVGRTDGSTIKVFINGVEDGSTSAGTSYGGATSVRVADNSGGYGHFAGGIAEVAMYPSALSPTRIAAHYAAT